MVGGTSQELILNICKNINPDIYISGKSGIAGKGKDITGMFSDIGVKVVYQNFIPSKISYRGYFSVVDLLFNFGPSCRDIIKSGWKW